MKPHLFYAVLGMFILSMCTAVAATPVSNCHYYSSVQSALPADTFQRPNIPQRRFDISGFGASISAADNAPALLKAIDTAYSVGGGVVVIPPGTYKCGPLKMRSNVALLFLKGATLQVLQYGKYPGSGGSARVDPFIDLNGLSNVMISGPGIIEGQGYEWWDAFKATKGKSTAISRPAIIGLTGANIIEISGITIHNAPNTHIGIGKNSHNITISDVTINSPGNSPNTDGIDTWSSHINIVNCKISCGDDNIAMDNNSQYINITGCQFGSGHGCSIGSYAANVDHITVNNCIFNGTLCGIHIKSSRSRSGVVSDLIYSNIVMNNVTAPINFREYYPDKTMPHDPASEAAQPITKTTPIWKHILLKNIVINGANTAGFLWAVPEMPMADIVLDNVKINAEAGFTANFVNGLSFINGSKIVTSGGSAFVSTYGSSNITGINMKTGDAQ